LPLAARLISIDALEYYFALPPMIISSSLSIISFSLIFSADDG